MGKKEWLLMVAVGLAGGLGALARYYAAVGATMIWGEALPWGTFAVNISGCFLLGWLTSFLVIHDHLPEWIAPVIGSGFIGSFTTFSAISAEVLQWLQAGKWAEASIYIACSAVGGMAAMICGWKAARWLSSIKRGGSR